MQPAALLMICLSICPSAAQSAELTPEQIIAAFRAPSSSTGNISDAVDEATGARGFMFADMKPIFRTEIVGRAASAPFAPGAQERHTSVPQCHAADSGRGTRRERAGVCA